MYSPKSCVCSLFKEETIKEIPTIKTTIVHNATTHNDIIKGSLGFFGGIVAGATSLMLSSVLVEITEGLDKSILSFSKSSNVTENNSDKTLIFSISGEVISFSHL